MKKILFVTLGLLSLFSFSFAQNISLQLIANSSTGLIQSEEGASLANSGFARVGTFSDLVGLDSFATAESKFTEFTNFTSSGGLFQGINNVSNQGATGALLYIFVTDIADVNNANEFGIFGSSSWTVAIPGGLSNLVSSQTQSALAGSIVAGSPNTYRLEAVPEPSAYAAIAGLLALSWVAIRRRK
ncbi:MAG TPA: hypothetical protein DCX06_03845 [Opitutae bacterium]|nr:hypothetical protein [Opitutae bacterium]